MERAPAVQTHTHTEIIITLISLTGIPLLSWKTAHQQVNCLM